MLTIKAWRDALQAGRLTDSLRDCLQFVEEDTPAEVIARFTALLDGFMDAFGADEDCEVACFSAPGRTELLGNHTDHQLGQVMAGSVTLDIWALARPNGTNKLRFQSAGWPFLEIDADQLEPDRNEYGTTDALLRGVAAGIAGLGHQPMGLDIFCQSNVLPGSGLSSSAACEILMAVIIDHFWAGGRYDATTWAKLSQTAENLFFGKPSGLMDQLACATGQAVHIDFGHPADPLIEPLPLDLEKEGYALCIIDSGADHADLTDAYASIPQEMKAVAAHFGKQFLREVEEDDFRSAVPRLRKELGDRAVLRAWHFYGENKRVEKASRALEAGDVSSFLVEVRESGLSSWRFLQNISPEGKVKEQALAVALAVAEDALSGRGAVRVHGGGFAGTIQAFVPLDEIARFVEETESVLGEGSCHVLSIRKKGAFVFPES